MQEVKMAKKSDSALHQHMSEVKAGKRCFENAFQGVARMILDPAHEPDLLEGLDASRIFRAGSTDPQRLMYLLGKRTITPGGAKSAKSMSPGIFPDSKKGWVRRLSVMLAARSITSGRTFVGAKSGGIHGWFGEVLVSS